MQVTPQDFGNRFKSLNYTTCLHIEFGNEWVKVHLTPRNVFRFINSMYVEQLNSETISVLNVALVSYRDMNLQNANKMTSIQDFAKPHHHLLTY